MVLISPQVAVSRSLYSYGCNTPRLPSDWSTLTSRLSSLADTSLSTLPSSCLGLHPAVCYLPPQRDQLSLPPRPAGLEPPSWRGPPSSSPAYMPPLPALYRLPDQPRRPGTSSLFTLYRPDRDTWPTPSSLPPSLSLHTLVGDSCVYLPRPINGLRHAPYRPARGLPTPPLYASSWLPTCSVLPGPSRRFTVRLHGSRLQAAESAKSPLSSMLKYIYLTYLIADLYISYERDTGDPDEEEKAGRAVGVESRLLGYRPGS